ncbi:uncharacterized protein LOC134808763 isoform X4 [Pan troglodytes]|uniref:uncharacterized protein LOC134808763 isoform X4 n=1 Tax=Pan troglodytes TaxID=9598 RepID=UPI003013EE83
MPPGKVLQPVLKMKVDELFLYWLSEASTQRMLQDCLRRIKAPGRDQPTAGDGEQPGAWPTAPLAAPRPSGLEPPGTPGPGPALPAGAASSPRNEPHGRGTRRSAGTKVMEFRSCRPGCSAMTRFRLTTTSTSCSSSSDAERRASAPGHEPKHSDLLLPQRTPAGLHQRGCRHQQDREHLRPVPPREGHHGRHGPGAQGLRLPPLLEGAALLWRRRGVHGLRVRPQVRRHVEKVSPGLGRGLCREGGGVPGSPWCQDGCPLRLPQ